MYMTRNKILMFGTTVLCGVLVGLVLATMGSAVFGIVGGIITAAVAFAALLHSFKKNEVTMQRIRALLGDENIKFLDTAGLMGGMREIVGAIGLTKDHFVFLPNTPGREIDLLASEIKSAKDNKGFLELTTNEDIIYRFKVFNCTAIVETLAKG